MSNWFWVKINIWRFDLFNSQTLMSHTSKLGHPTKNSPRVSAKNILTVGTGRHLGLKLGPIFRSLAPLVINIKKICPIIWSRCLHELMIFSVKESFFEICRRIFADPVSLKFSKIFWKNWKSETSSSWSTRRNSKWRLEDVWKIWKLAKINSGSFQ